MRTPLRTKAFLKEAVDAAATGDPLEVSVRQFIQQWGAERRGDRIVSTILGDLAKSKLTTEPDFRQVYIDTRIRMVAASSETATSETDDEVREYGLTVGTMPSASDGLVSVKPTQSLQVAYTRMLLNDYSQLAVIDGERSLKGAVTWRSITSALLKSAEAGLSDAIVEASTVKYSEDLLKLVPRIVAEDFVLVIDQTRV